MITAARRSSQIDWLVVSSDDAEILETARNYGADTVERPAELATDIMTLDPAVHHAVTTLEERGTCTPSLVATLQPTSPLLSAGSIDTIIEQLKRSEDIDTIISAVDDTHLAWRQTPAGLEPTYTERVCRQWLQKQFRETGGIVCSRREFITPTSRIGKRLHLEVIPTREAIDIDNGEDWAAAEAISRMRRIVFVVSRLPNRHAEAGMALANSLPGHQLTFLCIGSSVTDAFDLLRSSHYSATLVPADQWVSSVCADQPDAVVLIRCGASTDAVRKLTDEGIFVVAIHDAGSGAPFAHIADDPQTDEATGNLIERVSAELSKLRKQRGVR